MIPIGSLIQVDDWALGIVLDAKEHLVLVHKIKWLGDSIDSAFGRRMHWIQLDIQKNLKVLVRSDA
jgi:hypothetical protein